MVGVLGSDIERSGLVGLGRIKERNYGFEQQGPGEEGHESNDVGP